MPTTTYEHDDRGRMVSSSPEVEWDPEQRGWMLALAVYRATRCPNCGQDVDVCTDPDTEGQWLVPAPTRCQARTALSIAQKVVLTAGNPQPEALMYHVERR